MTSRMIMAGLAVLIALAGPTAAATASDSTVERRGFQVMLTVSVQGAGSGTVTSSPSGISCPGDCTENYFASTPVQLTATPAAGSMFAGWGGSCSGKPNPCELVMNSAEIAVANFSVLTPTPVDTDGDGVPDGEDNCRLEPGPASNGGCPLAPPDPDPPADTACERATAKLAAAKERLADLVVKDASDRKIDKAKKKVKKAKKAKKKACAA